VPRSLTGTPGAIRLLYGKHGSYQVRTTCDDSPRPAHAGTVLAAFDTRARDGVR
jgi:hypothetical protein